jgi:16S rRNA (guanine527-N7)-methyltransferase
MITVQKVSETLTPYLVDVDHELCEQIRRYIELVLRWNRKISLTSVTDPLGIVKFHFGESFFASKLVPIQNGRLADVGSGAGFPGIPLAMLSATLKVALIEPNAKKCAFLAEVVRALNLSNVEVIRSRMEALSAALTGFDFVTARALGDYRSLADWARTHLSSSGHLVLWLGGREAAIVSQSPSWQWRAPTSIPGSRNRAILVGSPLP